MSKRKEIGKIRSVSLGYGGYQGAMFGVSFDLGGKSWGVGDFKGTWATRDDLAKWTLKDQEKIFADTMIFIRDLMIKAKVTDFNDLKDVPVEIIFEGNMMKSWRILDEVI